MYYRSSGFEASRGDFKPVAFSSVSEKNADATTSVNSNPGKIADVEDSIVKTTVAVVHPRPRTYFQKLAFFRIIPEKPNQFLSYMYLPLKNFYTFPIVLWASFFHGIAVVCFNALNATASVILSAAPYNFSSSYVGLAYIGPTIGAIIGYVVLFVLLILLWVTGS